MKTWLIIACFAFAGGALTACGGDNGAHSGRKDTVSSRYGDANDTNGAAKSSIDTGKMTSQDNSASGGTKAGKDTLVKKGPVKK